MQSLIYNKIPMNLLTSRLSDCSHSPSPTPPVPRWTPPSGSSDGRTSSRVAAGSQLQLLLHRPHQPHRLLQGRLLSESQGSLGFTNHITVLSKLMHAGLSFRYHGNSSFISLCNLGAFRRRESCKRSFKKRYS